jgi:hypothetical protein
MTIAAVAAPRMSVPWPEEFPTELLFEILKYLPQGDLARACRVNKYCNCPWRMSLMIRVQRCFEYVVVDRS